MVSQFDLLDSYIQIVPMGAWKKAMDFELSW